MDAELPPPNTIRWVARRKAAVVVAVRAGKITLEAACSYYQLSEEELLGWQHSFDSHGLRACARRAFRVIVVTPSRGLEGCSTASQHGRPSIRLAALSKAHVIYVWTHDSIALGEDGPTHQPVEQLASLRALPDLTLLRPADANETVEAWKIAVAHARPLNKSTKTRISSTRPRPPP
jgi:hypothetical protein